MRGVSAPHVQVFHDSLFRVEVNHVVVFRDFRCVVVLRDVRVSLLVEDLVDRPNLHFEHED